VSDLPVSALGRRIKAALTEAGVSVAQVAKRLGIARTGFSTRLNAGRLKPGEMALLAELTGQDVGRMAAAEGHTVREAVPPYGDAPAPTFVEHVLFTAGRIAELANQIQAAAITQQRVSYDLGARAKSELGGAPSEAIVPAATPKVPKGRRTKGLNRKPA